jgi:hypothetical protein
LARTGTWDWFAGFHKLSQIPYSFDNTLVANEVFPEGELDADLQQVFKENE